MGGSRSRDPGVGDSSTGPEMGSTMGWCKSLEGRGGHKSLGG